MREIKFRAWSGGKMWQPFTLIEELNRQDEGLYPKDAVFLQYTGLKDKNGKEIYEGDIVRKDNKHIAEIIFKDGGFGTESRHYKQDQFGDVFVDYKSWHYIRNANTSIEIIGNIWDNSDLLKGVA